MTNIKSLADQLRNNRAKPDTAPAEKTVVKKKSATAAVPEIVEALKALDIAGNKNLVHVRFDAQTAQLIHHFKMATGIEVTRLLCYAMRMLLEQHPEIRLLVKEHLEKLNF